MIGTKNKAHQKPVNELGSPPNTSASKIGLVSRDYNEGDFSTAFEKILNLLDEEGCDTALFSLYTILEKNKTEVLESLERLNPNKLANIFIEYYVLKGEERSASINVVYSKQEKGWQQYSYEQGFGRISEKPKPDISKYVADFPTKRIMGNLTVVLCGETNIVKLNRKKETTPEQIEDVYEFLKVVPKKQIILNPIHDRMTRYEMKRKRKFLSEDGRWVLSVWNKGKRVGKSQQPRDGKNPPWTVFHDGCEITETSTPFNVKKLYPDFGCLQKIEIGIIDTKPLI
jgi:hypothetical protein